MKVKEIVKAYLEKNGYGGLYSPGECACKLDDLMPCACEGIELCEPGYFRPPGPDDEEADFYIGPKERADESD